MSCVIAVGNGIVHGQPLCYYINDGELGNISAVRAFDIEKDPDRIAEEINQLIDNEGDEISNGISALIEEARTQLPNGFHYTSNTGKRGVGVRNAGVGVRHKSDRGADNALDGGAHLATEWCFIKYRYSRCTDTIKCDQAE